jgi:PIN domain nuclease of toxin-antitoxin system
VAIKASLARLSLPGDALSNLDVGLTALRVTLLPVGHLHAKYVGQLPWIHKDPFDRLLISQAILEGATIITSDEDIPKYPGVTVVWA